MLAFFTARFSHLHYKIIQHVCEAISSDFVLFLPETRWIKLLCKLEKQAVKRVVINTTENAKSWH